MNDEPKKHSISRKPSLKKVDGASAEEYRPSDFMRARRPELFSDSRIFREIHLPRETFEYHLNTLTSRKQEIEFEYFCRRLAEKELCPNLLPQTGPTGGGDSKVDAETYPVADTLALRWYEGIGRDAGKERWAFAFSAKKDWHAKVISDVEGIIKTGRDYVLIYFITNQFVKDRTRAKVEDSLKRKYKINIRILDRSWIVKCIFEHDRLQLATETLSLTGYDQPTRDVAAGPRDTERKAELDELEQQINDTDRYRGVEYQLAEDCLQAALLARGLEFPRVDVEGRFQRAESIAKKVGHRQQQLRIVYSKAWTTFWWFNDFEEFHVLYDQVEELACGSIQATDLELLSNLRIVLHTTVMRNKLNPQAYKLDERTIKLKKELERLIADKGRPSNALQARIKRLIIDIIESLSRGKSLDTSLAGIKDALIACEGLAEFPVDSIAQIIQELGNFINDNVEYDKLFELVVSLTERRTSEGEVGSMLLQRGCQKFNAGKKYDAIHLLGRAQQKLAKSEYRKEWVTALYFCGCAYESVGLLWAARANILIAANQELSEYWKYGKLLPRTLWCIQRLIWIELQLGRVPFVLEWIDLASLIASQLNLENDRKEAFIKERNTQDIVLGILLSKTDLWELKWLNFLPEILEKLELDHSWMSLLYALGHEDYLRSEGVIPDSESPETVRSLFIEGLKQPVNDDLPDHPELMKGTKIAICSFVLGCEITVEAVNTPTSINLAETVLSALEAFLATSLDGELVPYQSNLHITIRPSDFITGAPEHQINKPSGEEPIIIRHAPILQKSSAENHEAFRSWLQKFLLDVTLQISMVRDLDSFTDRIYRDELSLGRALNFSDVSIAIENILGQAPRFHLSDWENQTGTGRFNLRRSLSWNHGITEIKDSKIELSTLRPGKGEPPADLIDIDNLKHKDRRVISFINLPLWDKAEWQATAYICYPGSTPILVLGFRNPDAAKQIFKELRSKIGEIDKEEQLRVSIITGIDKRYPSSYRVLISANLKLMKNTQSQIVVVSRMNRMDPPDSRNLNVFLEQYKRDGNYMLVPAHFVTESKFPELFLDLRINKQELNVRPAWQLGENDLDVFAIKENEDPIIPDEIKDAPVIGTLKRFAKRTRR